MENGRVTPENDSYDNEWDALRAGMLVLAREVEIDAEKCDPVLPGAKFVIEKVQFKKYPFYKWIIHYLPAEDSWPCNKCQERLDKED